MKQISRIGIWTLALTPLLVACQHSGSRQSGTAKRVDSVFSVLLVENQRYRNLPPDSLKHFDSDSVFHSMGITGAEFRSALAEYRMSPRKWQKLLEDAIKQLEEKEKQRTEKPTG